MASDAIGNGATPPPPAPPSGDAAKAPPRSDGTASSPDGSGQTPPAPGGPQSQSDRPTVDELAPEAGPQRTIWQSPFVQNMLPFLTSLALHIGIVLLVWATYEGVRQVYTVVKEQIIIPSSTIVENGPVGGLTNPGLGDDPNQAAAQDQFADVPADASGWSNQPSESLESNLAGGGGEVSTDSMIGVGTGGGFGAADKGVGSGDGKGGGPLAPFGVPGGGQGQGPKSQFLGVGGNAVKIVYVCDASGTMFSAIDALRRALNESISALKPIQGFNVIFFRDADVLALQPGGLVMANSDNKRKAFDFIRDVSPAGATNPIPAIEAAFAAKPELVYILTDGFDNVSSYDDVLKTIRRLNPGAKTKVNSILIRTRSDPELERVMKTIASENGGVYRAIAGEEMR